MECDWAAAQNATTSHIITGGHNLEHARLRLLADGVATPADQRTVVTFDAWRVQQLADGLHHALACNKKNAHTKKNIIGKYDGGGNRVE